MILTALVLGGAILTVTAIAGLVMLYQIRQATDAAGSAKAIFAADAGFQWGFYQVLQTNLNPPPNLDPLAPPDPFTNGAYFILRCYDNTGFQVNSGNPPWTACGASTTRIRSTGKEKQNGAISRLLELELPGGIPPSSDCTQKLDVMLVLDRSSSIDATELAALKTAANAFVGTLAPSVSGVHVGLASFASLATLNLHLSGDEATITSAINAIVRSAFSGADTNLVGGINFANGELDDAHVAHERPEVPDKMVIITDGDPNVPGGQANAQALAAAAADAARTAGIEIFAVGVGTNATTTQYLTDEIADPAPPTHYFSAASYNDLQTILTGLALAACSP